MKKCPSCSFENVDEAKYCINCGSRMDGNLVCPKCHNILKPSINVCPHCGYVFPIKEDANLSSKGKKYKSKKERLDPIFQKIFSIISIVAFFLSTFLLGSDIFTLNINNVSTSYNIFTLFTSFFNGDKSIEIFTKSIIFSLLLINAIITIVFSILGIVKSFKDLKKNPRKFSAYRELGIVLASNAASKLIIPAFFSGSNSFVFIPLSTHVSVIVLLLPLALMMIYRSFQLFSKNRPLIFTEKIVSSFVLYFAVLFLLVIGFPSIISLTNSNIEYGNFDFLIQLINIVNAASSSSKADFANLLIVEIISVIILIITIVLIISVIVYFTNIYFLNLEHKKAPKIPLYFVCLFIFVLSIMNLGLSYFTTYRFAYLVGYENVFPLSCVVMFIISSFLFASSLVSLNFTRRIVKQDKIIQKQENLLLSQSNE